jgi:hypothetical protein
LKTEQWVKVLAQDSATKPAPVKRAAIYAAGSSLILLAAIFALGLGFRPDIRLSGALAATGLKLAYTLSLGCAATFLLLRESIPAASRNRLYLGLLIAPAVLGVALVVEGWRTGMAGWQSELIGAHGLRCIMFIPALSVIPLAAALFVLQTGAPTRPGIAGAVAGVAAAALGASFYALNCTDDGPLFIVFWYGLAIVMVAALGAAVGRKLLVW